MKDLYTYIIYFFTILLVYGITINNDYNFNDQFVITSEESASKGIESIPSLFTKPYVESDEFSTGYRPFTKATFALEYSFFGNNPSVSHFINLLFFLLFVVLLHQFIKRWFPKLSTLFLLCFLMLFIVHSTHVEVIASLKNREEILCGIFYILFGFLYLDLVESKRNWIFTSTLLAVVLLLGFTTKQAIINVIFIPFIHLFLYPSKRNLRLTAGVTFLVFAIILRFNYNLSQNIPSSTYFMNMYENPIDMIEHIGLKIGFLANIFLHYIKLLLFPFKLQWYYGYNEIEIINWNNIRALLSIIILLSLIIIGFVKRKSKPLIFFGMSMLIANLLIYSSVLTPYSGIISERALFISSIGFCILFTLTYFKVLGINEIENSNSVKNSWKKLAPFAVIILVLGVNSFSRSLDWKDLDTLLLRDIPKQKQSAHANFVVGNAYLEQYYQKRLNRYRDEAIQYFKNAIDIDSTYLYSYNNLTTIYFNEKDYLNATKYGKMALKIDNIGERTVFQLASCYRAQNDLQGEISIYRESFKNHTDKMLVLSNLTDLYFKQRNLYSALNMNNNIHKIYPENVTSYKNLGAYYLIFDDKNGAIPYFEKAVELGEMDSTIIDFLIQQYETDGAEEKKVRLKEKLNQSVNIIQPLPAL